MSIRNNLIHRNTFNETNPGNFFQIIKPSKSSELRSSNYKIKSNRNAHQNNHKTSIDQKIHKIGGRKSA